MNWDNVISWKYTQHELPSFSTDWQVKKGVSPQMLIQSLDPIQIRQQRQQDITAEELVSGNVIRERIIERRTSKFYGLSFWLLVCGIGLSAYVLALGGFDFSSLAGMFSEGWSKLISFLG